MIVSFANNIFTNKRTCMTLDHYASLRNVRLGGPVDHTSMFIHPRVIDFSRHFGGHATVSHTLGRTRTSIRCITTTGTFSGKSFNAFLSRFFGTVRSHCSVRGPGIRHLVHQGLGVVGHLGRRGHTLGRTTLRGRGTLMGCTHRCVLVNSRYLGRSVGRTTVGGCRGTIALYPGFGRT